MASLQQIQAQVLEIQAELSALRRRTADSLAEVGLIPAERPNPYRVALTAPRPRFHVTHSYTVSPASTTNALALNVSSGTWWRDKVAYTWDKADLTPETYAEGTWYVVAQLTGDPLDIEVSLLSEADFLLLDTPQADLRVLAIVKAADIDSQAATVIWQRWYSDIYDGGLSEPADWDRDGDVYEDTGAYYLDVTKGHLHIHGRGLYELTATTQVEVQEGGYVYLEFDTTANSLAVRFETNFPESTDELYNFLLYKIEGFKVVRDLRTAFNFGSPI